MKWSNSVLVRAGVALAVLISVGLLSYMLLGRGIGARTAARSGVTWVPNDQISDLDNDRLERIMLEISPKRRIEVEDVRFLVEVMEDPRSDVAVQRFAIVTMGSLLGGDSQISDDLRQQLIAGLLDALSNPQAGSRRSAIVACKIGGLLDHPEVRNKIIALRDDPQPRVSSIAELVIPD